MNVIITGASKGMGKAIAEKFAANNHSVILCARNEVQLYQTMEELLVKYPSVIIKAKPADLSDSIETKKFGTWSLEEVKKMPGGSVDVLVNNAGQFIPGQVYNEEEGTLEKMMKVNLYSAYHLTRTLLPGMMENKRGHIFNVCSIASLNAYKNGGAYSISKFALLGFSKNLREEMKTYGIKVTAVMPGAVYTDSWSGTDVSPQRIMESGDIADLVYAASQLSGRAVVEEILVRPQLGDL
ncbi:MAG: SDR family NAD(P)-dependent oxidoreductase [Chitinophagaceae bacterium]